MGCSNCSACLASALAQDAFRIKIFYTVDVVFFVCVKGHFCFTKVYTSGRSHHTVRSILRLDDQKGGHDLFQFTSLSPIVRKGFENYLILWSSKHLCSFSDKPR